MSITPEVTFIPEWAEQDLVLLSWPNADMDWASRLPEIEACYRGIAEAILEWEDLLILAKDTEHVRQFLGDKARKHQLFLLEMECNDTWCRDYAPLSLHYHEADGTLRPLIVDFTFNGWGMKFAADRDNLVSRALYLSRAFTPDVAYVGCDDERDSHYHALRRMREELENFRTLEDKPYQLVELPLPPAIYDEEGERLPATYANFLFVNGALLVPTYGVPSDEVALERLRKALPELEVVGVDSRALIYQHGSLHCATMQFPKGFINKNKWN